jgi:D-alanyl-D-alanine dipeptidase
MWELVKVDRYTAGPVFGSGLNRGITSYLTIAALNTNKKLEMGTGFDHFSDTLHHDFIILPEKFYKTGYF